MSIDTYFCLCCLSTDQLMNIFEENHEGNLPIILKDLFCLKPSQEDTDDTYICNECVIKLKASADFKKQVFNSINVLQEMGLINLRKDNGNLVIKKVTITNDEENTETEIIDENIHYSHEESQETLEPLELVEIGEMNIINIEENMNIEQLEESDLSQVPDDLSCKYCDKVLPNVYGYNAHLKTHFPNHICEVCGKVFITEKRLKRHKAVHKIGPFVCDCGREFHNYNTYIDHRSTKHSSVLKYACLVCPKRFASVTQRARHMTDEHQCDLSLTCDECGKIFISSVHLNNHIKYNHLKLKRHACTTCDAKFYHKQDLQGHMAKHTGVYEFICQYCDKRFPRKKSLEIHKKIHTNDKRFGCDTCGKKFIQKASLIIHQKVHNCANDDKAKDGNAKVSSKKAKVKSKTKVETKVIGQDKIETVASFEHDKVEEHEAKVDNKDHNRYEIQKITKLLKKSEVDMNKIETADGNTKVNEMTKVEVAEVTLEQAKVDNNKTKVKRQLIKKQNDNELSDSGKVNVVNSEKKPLLYNSFKLFY